MKHSILAIFAGLATTAALPASVVITTTVQIPNGTASGGNGSGANSALTTTSGTISASTSGSPAVVTLPVATYSVTGVDLTSVGGTANESFSYTVTYTATSDGTTPASPTYSAFGNIGVGTGTGSVGVVNGSETLTATVALTSSSFVDLSLTGFSFARAGGVNAGESGTFVWTGGSFNILPGVTIASDVTGTAFTLTAGGASTINIEGFGVRFVAVPEPASASLLVLGALSLLRRKRPA